MKYTNHDVPTSLGTVRVRVAGAGPAILMWPSLLVDGSMWFACAESLADRYRVVLVDPPGHGESAPLSERFDFVTCAYVVVEVLDALEIERAHVVGNSWGAMIGGTFVALHPERAGVAVLMNGTASPCGARQRFELGVLIACARVLRGIRGPLAGRALRAFLGPTSLRSRPQAVAYVRAALRRADIRSVRHAIESVVRRRPDQRALFATIRTPVLVVAGAEDATFPPAETRAMAEAIPGARFVTIAGAAHLVGLELPRETCELVEGFVTDRTSA